MKGITYIDNFIANSFELFETLQTEVEWDESMKARKTCSYGKPYNYSQISYPFQEFTPQLNKIVDKIAAEIGFRPNNCLINYYLDGTSKMGFHSDATDILDENTGVVIVSIGATRTLRFKNIADPEIIKDFNLTSGSLIYMKNEVQDTWKHAILKSHTENGRMSLTFRKIK